VASSRATSLATLGCRASRSGRLRSIAQIGAVVAGRRHYQPGAPEPNIEWVTAVNFEEPNIGDRAMRSAAIGGLREEITGLIPWLIRRHSTSSMCRAQEIDEHIMTGLLA